MYNQKPTPSYITPDAVSRNASNYWSGWLSQGKVFKRKRQRQGIMPTILNPAFLFPITADKQQTTTTTTTTTFHVIQFRPSL
jgi:hypothetical protein